MKIVYFTHSLQSCWNHGNAHFLRGVLVDLVVRGHDVRVFEPSDSWSLANLIKDHGDAGLVSWRRAYPNLTSQPYDEALDPAEACDGADLVIVHEWNDPKLVAAIGELRIRSGRFNLLFHDTHHRAVSDPRAIATFDLAGYDGVLAFGETLAEVYRRWGWGERVFVWHEAADVRLFQPPQLEVQRQGLVWIGNWGDGERTAELEAFLLEPAQKAGLSLQIRGVRYPKAAIDLIDRYGANYGGWIANADAPQLFARNIATVHVPRRFYVQMLPGIPTIRVFEALACAIPLVSAPWRDSERLFRDDDFLMATTGGEVTGYLRALKHDPDLRRTLANNGLATILSRHTCAHRVDELLAINARISRPGSAKTLQPLETAP